MQPRGTQVQRIAVLESGAACHQVGSYNVYVAKLMESVFMHLAASKH